MKKVPKKPKVPCAFCGKRFWSRGVRTKHTRHCEK